MLKKMLHTNLGKKNPLNKVRKAYVVLTVIFIAILIIPVIYIKLFASTSFSWNFSTPSDYTLSDSNKMQITGGNVSLQQIQTNTTDDSQSEFDLGTYNNTQYSSGHLTLDSLSLSGSYTSKIYDTSAIDGVAWQNFNWSAELPYGKELPNNHATESGYSTGNIDMTGNLGLWHMNNTSDSSGYNHSVTLSGNAAFVNSDRPTKVLDLDGNGDYGTVSDGGSLGISTFTISAWVKITQIGTTMAIAGKEAADSISCWYGYGINIGSTGKAGMDILPSGCSNGSSVVSTTTLTPGVWYLITGVRNGTTGYGYIYVNGQLENSRTETLNAYYSSFLIGTVYNQYSHAYLNNFKGQIEDVAVWNRILSDTEILNIYKRGIQNVKYQIRSCDDNACSGESFIGPDGTSSSYYDEIHNTTNSPATFDISSLTRNQYFQYKATLESGNASYLPKISSNTFTYQNYPVDKPTVNPTTSMDLTYRPQSIDHFCEGTLDGSSNCTTTSTKPTNTELYYQVCSDTVSNCNSNNTWKYWDGAAWSNASSSSNSNTASTINTNISIFRPSSKFFSFKSFLSSGGQNTPVLSDVSLDVTYDTTAPIQNATSINISDVNDGDWVKSKPTINWTEGDDNVNGSGILGYCIALDEAEPDNSSSINPATSAGILHGLDDGVTDTYCDFIATGDHVDLSSIPGLTLTTGKQYYFSIKAVDVVGNIWSGSSGDYQDLISFRYDNTPPTNPTFISMPSNFISTKDATITWPVGDSNAANDVGAGLDGLQYKIGSGGTWYGDLHTGSEDLMDLLVNDGTYTTDPTYDYPNLSDGNNIIYFRTLDLAGNVSSSTVNGLLKVNTTAPSEPQNLSVTPSDNTANSYAFDWDPPATYTGSVSAITYCYTVNTLPSSTTCTYTSAGVTSLSADAFANQPDTNTFYVVAKDEAGNINYSTNISITFTYSGEAPGIPLNPDVADISNKDTSEWKLAVTWSTPSNVGAGVSNYDVYRSTTASASCSSDFGDFNKVSTVLGTSYVDSGLSQQDYYYCVKACDSANNCSAVSSTVTKYPTGKYTSPADLISGPSLNAKTTTKGVISWVTDRRSDSKIQYGLSSGDYFEEEVGISAQVTAHTVTLNNLKAGTTYYYIVKWTDEDGNTGTSGEKSFTTDPPPVITNVKVTNVGIDSALIKFTSNNANLVKIYYGKTTGFGAVQELDTAFIESSYTAVLTELTDGVKYYFKINPTDTEGTEYQGTVLDFTTLPRPTVSNIQIQEVKNVAQPTIDVTWSSNTDISSIVSFYPADNPDLVKNVIDLDLKTDHKLEVATLNADTKYSLVVKGTDAIGNEATSEVHTFTTATDTRPPEISNIKIEAVNPDSQDSTAQIVVSWTTDELATSQVLYGEGTGGSFAQGTQIDRSLSLKHVVIISNLKPSSVYHLEAVSEDGSKNETLSNNIVTITPQRSENALDIVLRGLQDIFSFL